MSRLTLTLYFIQLTLTDSDVHIYYYQHNLSLAKYASELHQRIRREFPELRIYKFWDRPVGPHTVAMFEVNLFTPAQFGAFVPWLVVNRGPLSVLLHPNTERGVQGESEERDHTQRAVWMGERLPLDLSVFREEEKKVQVKEVKIELDVGGLEERIRAAESSGGDVEVEGGRGKGKEVDEPVAGPSN